jgi:acetyltransferase
MTAMPITDRRTALARVLDAWTLEDDRGIVLRESVPADAPALQAFVRALSPDARYQRFLVGLAELPPGLLASLAAADQVGHIALFAEAQVYGRTLVVGEARAVVMPDAADTAEFAIAVAEDWQGAGIGSRLLRTLESRARAAGIRHLTGDVLQTNRQALDFMRQRGFEARTNREEPRLMRVDKAIGGVGAGA